MRDDEEDLLTLIDEKVNGPKPCPHAGVTMKNGGWTLEHNRRSPYFREWVHAHPHCRRSKFPGRKQPDASP